MRPVVFDTNVLLDLFVFNDFRALHLKQALLEYHIDALSTQTSLEEFADVISRPLFALEKSKQAEISEQWRSLSRVIDDLSLLVAPWQCEDPDDQVFLNLAYTVKPAILVSKDNALLKLANKTSKEGVLITSNYHEVIAQR